MPSIDHCESPRHNSAQIIRYAFQVSFLRNIFLVCLLVALLFPLYNTFFMTPAYRKLLAGINENEVWRTGLHLIRRLSIGDQTLPAAAQLDELNTWAAQIKTDFHIEKVKVFNPSGKVIFSTTPDDVGQFNTEPCFSDILARGDVYTQIITHRDPDREHPHAPNNVARIFVPLLHEGVFLGTCEIHYDMTHARDHLFGLQRQGNVTVILIAVAMMTIVVVVLFKASAAMLSHRYMDDALKRSRDELELRVNERTTSLIQANRELSQENSERRHAVSALRASEKRFRNLIETMPHGIRETNAHGTITFVNPAHEKIYGYSQAQMIGTPMFDLVADESEREQLRDHLAYIVEHQPHPSPWFSQDRTQSGRIIETKVDWRFQRDTQGAVTGLIIVVSDITHQKQAEKALLDNINFMNTLIDTIPTPVFFKDEQGVFLGCNTAYAKIIGLPKERILGRRLTDLDGINFKPMVEQYHQQDLALIRSPGIQEHEAHLTAAEGGRREYMIFKATFHDADERVAGLVGIMMDITERNEAEHQRLQLERQLQQAQKMEALGTLAGGIAHDFNNILAAIIGYSQIALTDLDSQTPVHGYIKRVLEAGERAGDLVKQILTFSRQGEIEPSPLQINTIVKEVLKLVRATLPVTVEIVSDIDSSKPVMADPVQIHQVMMNLCANAGYAMREKGGRLTVQLKDVHPDETFSRRYTGLKAGPLVKLSVADTGVGIPAQIMSRIFDPFFTTKPKNEGTGMGLSVVHGIITDLGGVVTVDSSLGQGARFDIYLPALDGDAVQSVVQNDPIPAGTERLLLVDDEIFQTDMLKHMLGLLGYKVHVCNSSSEALALFEHDPADFDLVITDMVMPELTGDELARRMLALRSDLP
ncbi:MAG: PAS domain S-box protein, partial [Desulfatitalea sp.]|nr:PAS domain S-box protein [Desulfatitalea sp.]NNK02601.1 PAS domain S-box protein [Desulfatitalea sp.]